MPQTQPNGRNFASSLLRSLYANNAQVYYKPHSLSSSIGHTVSNARAVSKRT